MKIPTYVWATALAMPLLYSCNEYRSSGYSAARVHVKTAPKSLERTPRHTPPPAPKPAVAPQAAPAQPPVSPKLLAPAQPPVPEKLLAPVATPAPAPKRDYPVMPGQNRRLKIR